MRICIECPVAKLYETDKPKYQAGLENGLFMQNAQYLSGKMVTAIRGTATGLNDARIEEIKDKVVTAWGNINDPNGEAAYLQLNPEIAKAVHDCEVQIQLGNCAIHKLT